MAPAAEVQLLPLIALRFTNRGAVAEPLPGLFHITFLEDEPHEIKDFETKDSET